MTATVEAGSTPATEPAAPSSGLLRAELRRIGARRAIRLLLGLALIGWLVAIAIGIAHYGHPSAADLAQAQRQVQQQVAQMNEARQQCIADPPPHTEGLPVDQVCGPPVSAENFSVDAFLTEPPFSLERSGTTGALGFGAVAAVLGFLIGATWIGAEWSTRSIVALLFCEPRRIRVMATKLGVLVLASAALGVLAQAAWLAMAGLLNGVVGDGRDVPDGFWSDLLALQGRSVALTVLAALVGFGLANLIRNTAAAMGAGFVYFAIVETAVRALRPAWQPWLLSNNAVALMYPGGLRIWIQDNAQGHDYVIHNLPAGILLTAVTAVVVGVGVVLFARRDLH